MSQNKKFVRKTFRDGVFKRDKYRCVMCGFQSTPEKAEKELDAHHITPREELPGGGYVKENGVTLCKGDDGSSCHEKAEMVLNGDCISGFSPDDLYVKVGSSYEEAFRKSKEMFDDTIW